MIQYIEYGDAREALLNVISGLIILLAFLAQTAGNLLFSILFLAWEYKKEIAQGILCVVGVLAFFGIILMLPWLLV